MICHASGYMIISVEATRIEMTEEPEVGYEGRVANFVCETDSAYPYSPSVLWFVDETPVNTKNGFTVVNNPLNGENHGNKTYSILRFIRKREMNMKRIKCMLGNNVEKVEEHILNVKCEYSQLHVITKGFKGFLFSSKSLSNRLLSVSIVQNLQAYYLWYYF